MNDQISWHQELTFDEIGVVGGGDPGDAQAGGAVTGAATAAAVVTAARYASCGARIAIVDGIVTVNGVQ